MSTEINGLPPSRARHTGNQGQVKEGRSESGSAHQDSAKPSTTIDTVSLTGAATRMRQLEQTLEGLPIVDTQRVAKIKQDIASGNYTIDPERIAEKLLELESELTVKAEK
jgi:negative regulator of flagellin synthesis FlgM